MKFLNLFKVLKFDSYIGIHEGSNSLISWFQVKETEITVPPSQSPSVVVLLNSLKNKFHQAKWNFAWWNIWISRVNLQNWELLKRWNSISYWNSEIPLFLWHWKLWLFGKGLLYRNHYFEWICVLKLGDKLWVYMPLSISLV